MIDARQSYLQDVVVAGLHALGYPEQADQSIHFSYEMVALSPRCCADLGIALSEEDRKRPYVEVSGRKGLGVKADDLMDRLIAKALDEVSSRHPDDAAEKNLRCRHADRHRRAALLPAEVHAEYRDRLRSPGGARASRARPDRTCNTPRCARATSSASSRSAASSFPISPPNSTRRMARQLQFEDFWQMLLAASKVDSAVESAMPAGEPAHVARYAFQLAQTFSNFYQKYSILHEPDRERKVFLLWMTDFFRRSWSAPGRSSGLRSPSTCSYICCRNSCRASKEIAQATLEPS